MTRRELIKVSLLLEATLILEGCSTITAIQRVAEITTDTESLVDILGSIVLSPDELLQVQLYLKAIQAGNEKALKIIGSGATGKDEALEIIATYALAVLPTVILPGSVQTTLNMIATTVRLFTAQLQKSQAVLRDKQKTTAVKPTNLKLSDDESLRISRLNIRNQVLKVKIDRLKK